MTLIDFGDFKIRFDPKEVRINIDGEIVDVGARREEPHIDEDRVFPLLGGDSLINGKRVKREDYIIYHKINGERISLDELMKRLGQKSP